MGGIAVLAVREGLCLLRHFSGVATNTFMRLKKRVGLFQSFIFWCVHQWELHVITLSCFVCCLLVILPHCLSVWAQSVTAEYRSVKLVNMTTSWRSGLGFLAIIHHFHPELL